MMTTFESTDEQTSLRKAVAQLLDREAGLATTRSSGTICPEAAWGELTAIGLLGLLVDEESGGAGASMQDLAVVLHEMGRRLVPGPFLAHAGLGATMLAAVEQSEVVLSCAAAVTEGTTIATVAAAPTDLAVADGTDGVVVTGRLPRVLAGDVADVVLVPRRHPTSPDVLLIETAASSVIVTATTSVDPSRGFASIDLEGARAQILPISSDRLERALGAMVLAMAAEQVGSAEAVLDMVVEYVRTREQFGRPIGAFQAVKHRCAEMYVAIEHADVSVRRAIADLDAGAARAVDPYLAALNASAALGSVARTNIQLHGAIGFTWEHDAPRYLKRALSTAALLDDFSAGVDDVADLVLDELLPDGAA